MRRSIALSVLLMVVVAAACGGSSANNSASPTESATRPPAEFTREEKLGVCVEEGPGYGDYDSSPLEEEVANNVRQAFERMKDHWAWGQAYPEYPPIVTPGCGAKARFHEELAGDYPPRSVFETQGRRVEDPSPYRAIIFVLPTEDPAFANIVETDRISSEELICGGDSCASVTMGIYLTTDEAENVDALEYWLREALGMDPDSLIP